MSVKLAPFDTRKSGTDSPYGIQCYCIELRKLLKYLVVVFLATPGQLRVAAAANNADGNADDIVVKLNLIFSNLCCPGINSIFQNT